MNAVSFSFLHGPDRVQSINYIYYLSHRFTCMYIMTCMNCINSTMTHSWFRANLCLHSADDSVHILALLFILLSLHGK